MKRIITVTIILIALAACATHQIQAGMPNPASVYCEQNGNQLEIHPASDGSQSGICVFPDGSTCDEWAYFRGECGSAAQKNPTSAMIIDPTAEASDGTEENGSGGFMPPGTTEEIADWWG